MFEVLSRDWLYNFLGTNSALQFLRNKTIVCNQNTVKAILFLSDLQSFHVSRISMLFGLGVSSGSVGLT